MVLCILIEFSVMFFFFFSFGIIPMIVMCVVPIFDVDPF